MQDGAGTSGLINLFSTMLSNKFYDEQTKRIKEHEHVIIKSKESVMREYYEAPKGRASDVPTRKVVRAPQRQPIPQAEVIQSKVIIQDTIIATNKINPPIIKYIK